jgi:predicted secreted protein
MQPKATMTMILGLTTLLFLGCGQGMTEDGSQKTDNLGKADKTQTSCQDLGGYCAGLGAGGVVACQQGYTEAQASHGCGSSGLVGQSTTCCLPAQPAPTVHELNKGHDKTTVQVEAGDLIRIKLAGNPTTGYQWKLDPASSLPLDKETYVPDQPTLCCGYGGIYTFELSVPKTAAAGSTFALHFDYYRPWEGTSQAIDTFDLELKVKGSAPAPGEHKLVKGDNGKSLQVQPGDKVLVELAGNPTTGYQWKQKAGALPLAKETYVPDQPILTGSGGTYTFELTIPAAAGKVYDLQFDYFRPWEGPGSAIETFKVTLIVP